ncbi:MAG: hypothetical protein H8D27_01865 [Chlorobium phaeobacteroides]|nr:hypothetical protein [Chlorobium phaeobacteroides]
MTSPCTENSAREERLVTSIRNRHAPATEIITLHDDASGQPSKSLERTNRLSCLYQDIPG